MIKNLKFTLMTILFVVFSLQGVFAQEVVCWEAWDPAKIYSAGGTQVSYNGSNYKNAYYINPGVVPGAGNNGWTYVEDCGPGTGGGDPEDSPQQFMTMGCDLSNPLIDPYLTAHSVYADSMFFVWEEVYSPANSLVGTAGTVVASSGSGSNCWNGALNLRSGAIGYFRKIATGVKNSGGSSYTYQEATGATSGCLDGKKTSVYFNLDESNSCRTSATYDKVNDGKFRPRFPDFNEVSSKFTGTAGASGTITPGNYGNIIVSTGQTVFMEAGTYFINGSIIIEENAKLVVVPKDGSFKTTIYVKERFHLYAGNPNQAKEGGAFYPDGFSKSNCADVPEAARGQILVIAFSTGIEDKENGDDKSSPAAIIFGSNASVAVGTFIAPRGGIFPMCGSMLNGQLLAKVVKFAYGYNSPNPQGCSRFCPTLTDGISFTPLLPPTISVPTKLLEDAKWKEDVPPTYSDGITWSSDKNRDRVDTIWIESSEPWDAGSPTSLPYIIVGKAAGNNYAKIGELSEIGLTDFPTGDLTGGAWRSGINLQGQRAFVKTKTDGRVEFVVGEKKAKTGIPILIIDDGEYQAVDTSSFFIEIEVPGAFNVQDPCNCKEGGEGKRGFTIEILSDDPDKPHKPTLNQSERVVEKYDGLAVQKVGTLQTNKPEYTFELTDNASGWFELKNDNEIWTTGAYNANYDAPENQQEVIIKAIAHGTGTVSDTAEIKVQISPWNDNAFTPNDDVMAFDFADGDILLNVLENDNFDDDLPKNLNKQKLIGLTQTEIYSTSALVSVGESRGDVGTQTITTTYGKATIENGQIRYEVTDFNAPKCSEDVFYYTALDTAEYKDHNGNTYETDVFIKSVKVTITNQSLPMPLDSTFFYDANGDGNIDEIIIPFSKDIENLNDVTFDLEFGSVVSKIYGADNKTIVLLINGTPDNKTNGTMNITVKIPSDCGDDIERQIVAYDKAAPVLIESAEYVKSLVAGKDDILIVKMSENFNVSVSGNNNPFKFAPAQTGPDYTWNISFSSAVTNGNICTLTVNSGVVDISDGDWIFINSSANSVISDNLNNEQKVADNKRVPLNVKTVTNITWSAYFDTSSISDGYVDLIKVDVGTEISAELAQKIADAIMLPSRFTNTKTAISMNDASTGFSFGIVESSTLQAASGNRDNFPPRTSFGSDELIVLETTVIDGAITVDTCRVTPDDSVAPVILYAEYSGDKNPDTTLNVVFSEAVNYQSGNPYLYWTVSGDEEFTMEFHDNNPTKINDNTLQYGVKSVSISFPVKNDSIWIVNNSQGYISDKYNNHQYSQTVRARLDVPPYNRNFNVYAVSLDNEKSSDFFDCYKITEKKGIAIVVEATGPVSINGDHNATLRVLDALGNIVRDDIVMSNFGFACNGKFYGAVVWDGKNNKGRNVGAGAYLGLIQVEIMFDDPAAPLEARTIRKTLGVQNKK